MFPSDLVDSLCNAIETARPHSGPGLVAIDGPGCAGKTALADALEKRLGSSAVSLGLDGFFLPFAQQNLRRDEQESLDDGVPHLRWGELRSVLTKIERGEAARYQPYDWENDVLLDPVDVPPRPVVLVEGLYALHQHLRDVYRLKIWVDTRRNGRMDRVAARDGYRLLQLWSELYVPRERSYLRTQTPFDHASIFVLGADLEWPQTATCFSRLVEA